MEEEEVEMEEEEEEEEEEEQDEFTEIQPGLFKVSSKINKIIFYLILLRKCFELFQKIFPVQHQAQVQRAASLIKETGSAQEIAWKS